MNIKLYIGSELADFNEAFNVVFSIGDIRDLGFGNNNKSYTLNLPLTRTNKRLLSFITQSDVKTEPSGIGRLYIGEQLIIQGVVVILNYTDTVAEVIISSDDWVADLASKKLSELDLSAYDHALTHATVEDSWTASYPFYRYPMINFGALASGEIGTTAKWSPVDFIPMFQVAGIISKILAPYTISSTWLTANVTKDIYIIGKETVADNGHIKNKDLEVTPTTESENEDVITIVPTATDTASLTSFKAQFTTQIKNEGGYWQAGEQYTFPETGTYRFICEIQSKNSANGVAEIAIVNESYYFRLKLTRGVTVYTVCELTSPTYAGTELIDGITFTLDSGYYHFIKDDVLSIEISLLCRATNNDISDVDVAVGLTVSSNLKTVWNKACQYSGLQKNISAEEMLPDMSQLDFLAKIKEICNFRMWMDRINRVIYIEPWDQLVSSTVVDLTDKVDYNDPNTELISKEYSKNITLKWKDDTSDKVYEAYLFNTPSPGKKDIALTSIYTKKEIDIREHSFSSIITDYNYTIWEYTTKVPSILTEPSGAALTIFDRKAGFNTRIVEWKGLTAGFTWYYETETKTTYPKIQGLDWTSLYTSYWQKLFHYIDKGKLRTVRIKATVVFLSQFFTVINTATSEGFRPTYQIDDDYYFLQKMTTDGIIAELELILK